MSLMKHVSKENKNRHFPNKTHGGKGDCIYRGRLGKEINNERDNNYRANKFWDNCEFAKKQRSPS